jgi:hypothetical protein
MQEYFYSYLNPTQKHHLKFGICRRAVITGRAVRVKSQLQSHKRFATVFHGYCSVVDNARLYSTNSMGAPKVSSHSRTDDPSLELGF